MNVVPNELRELVHRSCFALDREDFPEFLSYCAPSFEYRISTYSPEIRKPMIWFDQDYGGLESMFDMVSQHLKRLGTLFRHPSMGIIDRVSDTEMKIVTSVLIVDTDPNGRSKLFAAARYTDTIDLSGTAPRLTARFVNLETRDLGVGSHIPL